MTLLIIDNSCLDLLAGGATASRFSSNARSAGLLPAVTEINLLEAVAAPSQRASRVLATLRRLADGRPMLPWTFSFLKLIGQAISDGTPTARIDYLGLEWLLEDTAEASKGREAAAEFNRRINDEYESAHRDQRQKLQKGVKERGLRGQLQSARSFLDYWQGSPIRTDLSQQVWEFLGLPGTADIARINANDAWSLFLDAEGYALFEYSITTEQRSVAQRMDLLQLPYLGVGQGEQRIFVTEDNALLTAADEILRGRYAGSRAVHIQTLVT